MQGFSFRRFFSLLSRTLEIATVAALVARWIGLFVAVRYRSELAGLAIDVAAGFAVLAIVLLLLGNLWMLLTRQPRAVSPAVRTLVYILLWMFGPMRLGGLPGKVAQRPNQEMEQTASGRYDLLSGSLNQYPVAMVTLARGSSSCSR